MSDSMTARVEKEFPKDRDVSGPFDAREAIDVKPYVDFGGLLILPREGLQLRLEVEEESKRVVAITTEIADSTLQVQAFAASRSDGLWSEIRAQIEDQIAGQGGTSSRGEGELGTFVRATSSKSKGSQPEEVTIFVGVDGPRWFLRGVISGKATKNDDAMASVIEVFRSIVVNRGTAPMPPRDLIPLRIPAATVAPSPHSQKA